MEAKEKRVTFIDSLDPEMSPEDFKDKVRESLTKEDEKVLGAGYEDQMIKAILYPAIFAPYPATFGTDALAGVIDDFAVSDFQKTLDPTKDIEHTGKLIERTQHLISRLTGFGVIEFNEEGRCFIRPEVVEKLMPILKRFEE